MPPGTIWSFDANRNLLLQAQGLTSFQIAGVQSWCDSTFGPGKVVVS